MLAEFFRSAAPKRYGALQANGTLLGQPDRTPTEIGVNNGYLHESVGLKRSQVARQRGLVQASPIGKSANGVVRRRGDVRHQPELRQ